jgi:flagellar motor switch protein FliN
MAEQPPPEGAPSQPDPQPAAQSGPPAPAQPPAPGPAESAPSEPAASAAEDGAVDRASIDALLKQANFDSPDANAAESGEGPSIEELLQQANFEDTAGAAAGMPGAEADGFKLPSFQQVMADAQVSSIDLLRDVELNVKIELGRSRMVVEEVLQLSEGSVVELDKLAGDPVDVFVNDRLVARGEVLVLNDNFCVRVNEIVPAVPEDAS